MTRVVFLVPRRADDGHRDELWRYARKRWEALFPECPVFEGHHDVGPFNRSAAVNLAADLADEAEPWDVGVVIDSDVFLRRSAVAEAVELATETGQIVWPHTRWRGLSELWTKRTIDDRHDYGPEIDHDDLDVRVEKTNPLSWSCCIVIPRAAWDRLGGFDERFEGWGYEDMAFQSAVVGLLPYTRLPVVEPGEAGFGRTDVYHLWHPRSGERIAEGHPGTSAAKAYVNNARLGRRYMIALRRDYNRHDRPNGWADPNERERDIANLVRDEEKFASVAARHGLPDWSDWWPSLEELVEGAKAYRRGATPKIAVIVRTGGEREVFEDRIEYLDRSLASLVEKVSGPISRRVIYSDWADDLQPRIEEVAGRYGFYVVGGGHHGYGDSVRRLWTYISKRVDEPYVFVAEDDFVYLREVELSPMVAALRKTSRLRQIALLREAIYPNELERGGILGWDEKLFERVDGRIEHRNFWTMNPFLASREIAAVRWPIGSNSEKRFGDEVFRDGRARVAFWGDGEPWIAHLGEVRAASEY